MSGQFFGNELLVTSSLSIPRGARITAAGVIASSVSIACSRRLPTCFEVWRPAPDYQRLDVLNCIIFVLVLKSLGQDPMLGRAFLFVDTRGAFGSIGELNNPIIVRPNSSDFAPVSSGRGFSVVECQFPVEPFD